MKNTSLRRAAILSAVVSATLAGSSAKATNLFWSGNGTTQGGAGTWDTATAHFGTSAGGPYTTIWNNANVDSAEFGGTASTAVNLSGGITVGTITFDISGFTIGNGNGVSGAANTLTFSGTNSGINVNTTSGSTISTAVLSGVINKWGTGRLEMNNSANPSSSKYIIHAGVITAPNSNRFGTAPGSLVSDFFTLDGGGLGFNTTTTGIDVGATRGMTIGANGGFFSTTASTVLVTISSPIVGTSGGGITFGGNPSVWTGSAHTSGGVWTLSNTNNSWDGNLTLNGASGTQVKLGASGVIPDTAVVTLSASGNTFSLNGFDETVKSISGTAGTVAVGTNSLTASNPAGETYSSVISASAGGKFVKAGTGTLILSGSNTGFNGEFDVNNGVLGVGGANIFGNSSNTGSVVISGGKLSNTSSTGRSIAAAIPVVLAGDFGVDDTLSATQGQILFNGNGTITNSDRTINVNGAGNFAIGGILGQDGSSRSLTKTGSGTLVLNNVGNNYSGNTTITQGVLQVDGDGALGTGAGTLYLNGGRLNASASRTVAMPNPISVTANSEVTVTTNAATPQFEFSSNTVGGDGTSVLTFRNDGADDATDNFQPRFSGSGFNFSNPIDIENGAVGKTTLHSFNTTGTAQTFSGPITGNGAYTRNASTVGTGGETVFTSNSNTYSGGTIINRGKLTVNNTSGSATGTGSVLINSDGTLGGTGLISGPVFVGGKLSPGSSVGKLHTGSETWQAAGSYDVEVTDATGAAGTGYDSVAVDQGGGSPFVNITATNVAGSQFTVFVKGTAANFDNTQNYSWILADASDLQVNGTSVTDISQFDPTAFVVDTTNFTNNLNGGSFAVGLDLTNKDVLLNFTANVPEPTSVGLLLIGGTATLLRRRRSGTKIGFAN